MTIKQRHLWALRLVRKSYRVRLLKVRRDPNYKPPEWSLEAAQMAFASAMSAASIIELVPAPVRIHWEWLNADQG